MGIDPALVEKDYWIMHCLYGLQRRGFTFQLKGGTSLSKGFAIIDRFSEDLDILIEPPPGRDVKTGRNHTKPAHDQSRKTFYDWLADTIRIDGIQDVKRDTTFDDKHFRNGGIRLYYDSIMRPIEGLKEGILLEVGFDDVAPNTPRTISSWAYESAKDKVEIVDNRAIDVPCYDPGYTLVEKLQTISTKFRQQQQDRKFPVNFMRIRRCLSPLAMPRSSGIHRHGGLQGAQTKALSPGRQPKHFSQRGVSLERSRYTQRV